MSISLNFCTYGGAQLRVIKARLNNVAISRAEIARRIGMRPDYFGHVLSGKRPLTLETVGKLCTILDTTQHQIHREALQLCDE